SRAGHGAGGPREWHAPRVPPAPPFTLVFPPGVAEPGRSRRRLRARGVVLRFQASPASGYGPSAAADGRGAPQEVIVSRRQDPRRGPIVAEEGHGPANQGRASVDLSKRSR